MIITISGKAGAGKTTVGRMLAEKMNCDFISGGHIRREFAKSKGMTIDELNDLRSKDKTSDIEVDEFQKKLAKELERKKRDIVIESRLGFYFIPNSFKIFLTVDPTIAAERIFYEQRESELKKSSIEETKKTLKIREESDRKTYKELYGLDCYNKKHYDLVIDTTNLSHDEVVAIITEKLKNSLPRGLN